MSIESNEARVFSLLTCCMSARPKDARSKQNVGLTATFFFCVHFRAAYEDTILERLSRGLVPSSWAAPKTDFIARPALDAIRKLYDCKRLMGYEYAQ